jgi:hypothetical protein
MFDHFKSIDYSQGVARGHFVVDILAKKLWM